MGDAAVGDCIGALVGCIVDNGGLDIDGLSILKISSLITSPPVDCELSGPMIKITDPASISNMVMTVSVRALFPLDM